MSDVRFQPMVSSQLEEVVDIHMQAFPHSRSTQLGRRFVRRMYLWFITAYPQWAFVLRDDRQVLGFFVSTERSYRSRMFLFTLPEIIRAVALTPAMWFNRRTYFESGVFVKAVWAQLFNKRAEVIDEVPTLYCASMAVSPTARGSGLMLLMSMEQAAFAGGIKRLRSTVEQENSRLCEIYRRLGWCVVETTERSFRYMKEKT